MLSTKSLLVILLAVSYCLAEDQFPNDKIRPSHGNLKPNHKQSSDNGEKTEDEFPTDEVRPSHGNLQKNNKQSSDVDENGTEQLHRQKRGWGSIAFTSVSTLLKLTSHGLTFGSALTEGCMYYPSICEDKQEIERLGAEIKHMTKKYEIEYESNKKMYYSLKTANTDNAYIKYYITQTVQAVQTLQDIESRLSVLLQIKLPKISQMASATARLTLKKYLRQVFGNLEYRLSDLKKMLLKYKNSALIGLAVQFVVEATVKIFVNAIQSACKQIRGSEDILASTSTELWERMDGPLTKRFRIVERLKLTPKVLKQTAKNIGKKFRNFGKNIKRLTTTKSRKGFLKGKLKNIFKSPLRKLREAKHFFSPSKNKFFVKNYRLGTPQKIMMPIGIIADTFSTGLQVIQWKDVLEKMEKARKDYQQYHAKWSKELQAMENETLKMKSLWTDVVGTFKHLSTSFKQLVVYSKFSNFSDVIGLPRLPVDTSGPLFSINFNSVTKESIRSQQHDVIQFLKKVNNNITEIHDKLSARTIMYKYTLHKTETEETVEDMQSGLKNILQFNPSGVIREFGDALNRSDMVCVVSILRYDLEEYDYFPIAAFRPQCDVNSTIFEHWNQQAHKMKTASLAIKSDLDVCRRYGFCPCLSQVATTSQLAEKEFFSVLRHLDPFWQQNTAARDCIPSDCRCFHL